MRRIESVEALRGLAALSVSWFHFTGGSRLLDPGWLQASGAYGWLGVDVFFVISGFVIPYSMHRAGYAVRRDAGRFLGKRLRRLYPPYLAAVVFTVVLLYASAATPGFRGPTPGISVVQLLLHAVYLPERFGYHSLNPVFWTLGIEVQYYILVALLFPLLVHPSASVRIAVLAALSFGGALVPSENVMFHFGCHFALGMLVFQYVSGLVVGRLAFLGVLALLAVLALPGLDPLRIGTGVATALAIAFLDIPHTTPLTLLGTISYSYYLVHVPIGGRVLNLGGRVADSLPDYVALLLAAVALSLAVATVMYRWIERPAQRWSARLQYGERREASRR